jgi:hypothetical protein
MKIARVILALAVVCSAAKANAAPSAAECAASAERSLTLRTAHKLRDARAELLVCAAPSCPAEIREECDRRITDVNAAMPTIVFEALEGDHDVTAVSVTMDGAKLASTLDGTSIAIEPGEHTFRFELAGRAPVDKKLVIREGEKERRERIAFVAPTMTTNTTPPPPVTPPIEEAPPRTQRTVGIVLGATGLVSLVAGMSLGIFATVKWNAAKTDCGAGCAPDAPAQREKSDAQGAATGANITLIAGGVLFAAGLVTWLTAPRARVQVQPAVGWNSASVVLSGTF